MGFDAVSGRSFRITFRVSCIAATSFVIEDADSPLDIEADEWDRQADVSPGLVSIVTYALLMPYFSRVNCNIL